MELCFFWRLDWLLTNLFGLLGRMMYIPSKSLGDMLNFRASFVHLNFECRDG
jgi:hypothetical protein